ncbi:MAG: complex I NDUFA9 subunit family protein [Hyphomonadaceae bacterium]
MTANLVTVFGGSGFLGRHVVRALCKAGWRVRVAMRRPHLGGDVRLAGDVGQVQLVQANVRNKASVERAVDGAHAVVNLVGILFERGRQSFNATHVLGARNVAEAATAAGITRLVHVSALGVDRTKHSAYARSKMEAERAVRAALPTATIIRPSVMFGAGDGFFNRIAETVRLTFVTPVIAGKTKFQPVFVTDVAQAVANAVSRADAEGETYELAGPHVYTMKELTTYVTRTIDRPRVLAPLPGFIAGPMGYAIGAASRLNPFFGPPLTGDQVQMLRVDSVPSEGAKGFADLGVEHLETVEAIVPTYLWRHRPYGQFQDGVREEELLNTADA